MPKTMDQLTAEHALRMADITEESAAMMEQAAALLPNVEQMRVLHQATQLREEIAKTRRMARSFIADQKRKTARRPRV